MSKLQELINKLCPNGVEFKPLGEVCEIKRGVRVVKQELEEFGDIPVFQNSLKPLGYYKLSNFKGFTSFVIGAGAAGEIGFSEKPFWAADDCFVIISNYLNDKYIFYCLQNNQLHLKRQVRKASIPRLSRVSIEKFMIPIPPIEVQEEIVRILDSFSDYAAELQAELQARKQQYEYYRNLLLTFNPSAYGCGTDDEQKDGVTTWGGHNYKIEWEKMGDVFEMRNGYTPSKNKSEFWVGGTIPWFRMDDIRENGRILSDSIQHITPSAIKGKGLFEANSFILATTATIGEHALIIADSLANQRFTNLKVRKSLSNLLVTKFIYYYMFIVDDFCKKNTNVSGFASVDMDKLKRMPFPIPPLELQEKIVAILDRFETLVNDLTNGLPAEIAAVKDQYEYYRNKLLTFKKLSA
ncbi:MAG: restriction endonuclease subunit S [Bacteroidales bacterium]|nr:restriction endonuclease subunit S [Bacteroidales bacterium]